MDPNSYKTRRVVGYLKPSIASKFRAYIQGKNITQSEALNEAVRILIESATAKPSKKPPRSSY